MLLWKPSKLWPVITKDFFSSTIFSMGGTATSCSAHPGTDLILVYTDLQSKQPHLCWLATLQPFSPPFFLKGEQWMSWRPLSRQTGKGIYIFHSKPGICVVLRCKMNPISSPISVGKDFKKELTGLCLPPFPILCQVKYKATASYWVIPETLLHP